MSEQNNSNSGAEIQEPSLFQKIVGMIFVGDLSSAVRNSLTKVVGPKFNELIATSLKYIIDGIFKGTQAASPTQTQQDPRIQSTLFSSYWSGVGGQAVPKLKTHDVQRPMSQDIWFPTADEANATRAYMIDICAREGKCTVNQLYDKVGLTVPATAVNWGWRDFFSKSSVIAGLNSKGLEGYILHTSKPIYLE